MKKRVLSALLVLCMACSMVSTVWAANEQATPETADKPASVLPDDSQSAPVTNAPAQDQDVVEGLTAPEDEEAGQQSDVDTPDASQPEQAESTGTPVDGGVEYTAALEQDGQALNVIVTAPEGAFDAGVEPKLSVSAIEDETALDTIASKLEGNVEYDGFAALDISFKNEAGEEIEPNVPVTVRIELPQAIVDSGIDLNTLAVQHLEEDADGNVQNVTEVATLDNGITLSEEAAAAANEAAGVAPMSNMPAEEATAGDAAETPAAVAEFEVDGFSSFVITWNNSYYARITVYCVDESGKSIGDNLEDIDRSSTITMADIAPKISGYDYDHAVIARNNNQINRGTEFTQLRYDDYQWKYRVNSNSSRWNDINYYSNVYLVYSKAATEIETVPTVDSTAEGVHMYMFNYNYPAFSKSIAEYGDGSTKNGYASRTTDANGWPNLQATVGNGQDASINPSFSNFFGNVNNAFDLSGDLVLPDKTFWNGDSSYYSKHYLKYTGQEVNHLFRQDKFDEDGTFYYSSFENFATLKNDGNNNFTVYDALGTPSGENQYYFKRGNFMPYNTLNTSDVPWHNLYSETGTELQPGDPGYNDPVYGLNEEADFYFGMYVWADFYQPKDGVVESNDGTKSKPMVFEFTGDDDMWVYIDGVLVLDLGGIHDAQSGSINFATGEITWTDTPTSDHTNPDGYKQTSTLLAKYQAAGAENTVDWDGNTFADGSNHRIEIFYMERGDGASNLKISFNLKTIPDGQFSVRKDVENYYAPQMADIEYTMQAFVDGEPYANQEYTLFGKDESGTTGTDGKFKIKANETAVFADLTVGNRITVKEVGWSNLPAGVSVENAYDISYTVTDGSGHTVDGGESSEQVTATMPGYGSINVVVTNTAKFTRPLKIVKNFSGTEGNTAPEGFQATYTLYEVSDTGTKTAIGSIRYSDMEEAADGTSASYIFWLETGKQYTVEETFDSENDSNGSTDELPWQSCTVTASIPASGTEASDGIVELKTTDAASESAENLKTITLTNVYGQVKNDLSIIKAVSGDGITSSSVSDQTFTFTVTAGSGVDTELLSGTFQVTNGTEASVPFTETDGVYSAQVSIKGTGTLTIQELPIGTYTISEAQPGDLDDYYYVSNSLETGDDEATVSATSAGSITVTNHYEHYKSMTLDKSVTGTMGTDTDQFTFTIQKTTGTLNDGDVVKTVDDDEKVDSISHQDDITTIVMTAGGKVTLNKLKDTDVIVIAETDPGNGYSLKTITVPENDNSSDEAAFVKSGTQVTVSMQYVTTTSNDIGNINFLNERNVVAPTGLESNHTTPYTLMVTAAGIAGLALIGGIVVRRRRRRME